ncbi:aldolase/citrate lyase family protein [Enterocloster bolteae]|uniref:aldolase/citrate lyase family protein n=1 Tax=Enterocloster bolteae TaxID=208479 RepID=UPI00189D2F84|nr:aldolase/citrate lyase family protein [Enterocloster bolteae]
MSLKLMYITNRPEIAQIAESAGVNRILVDMEYIGKAERQKGMDTVQSHHTAEDVKKIKKSIFMADVVARVNPIHEATINYVSSEEEINEVIKAGADIVMLPYFKTVEEVYTFINLVNGRAKTLPLVETPEAVNVIDEILKIPGLDEVFIGLNDLSLGYGKKFMFELLSDGTVERLSIKFKQHSIPYGFGGIASLGRGLLPSEYVIREHYRIGSTCAILSRSFCNVNEISHMGEISSIFMNGIREIRELEAECQEYRNYFAENLQSIVERVKLICRTI